MENFQNNHEVIFDKYYPQHPLPKEIKELPEKETVCQFCGISYLIHSEIKRLEEEIISLNKRIRYFEEIEINEKKYENKCISLDIQLDQMNVKYSSLEENVHQLRSERDLLQTNLSERDDDVTKLESTVKILSQDKEKLATKHKVTFQQLFELKRTSRDMRDNLCATKTEMGRIMAGLQLRNQSDVVHIVGLVDKWLQSGRSDVVRHEQQVGQMQAEMARLKGELDHMAQQAAAESDKSSFLNDKYTKLLRENNLLEHQLKEKSTILSQKDDIIKLANQENEEIRTVKLNDVRMLKDELISLKQGNEKLLGLLSNEKLLSATTNLELNSTNMKLENISISNNELSDRITKYEDEIKQLKEILDRTQKKQEAIDIESGQIISGLTEKLSAVTTELTSIQQSTNGTKMEMEHSFNEQKSLYEKEIDNLQAGLKQFNKTRDKLAETEKENLMLQKVLSEYTNANKQLIKKIENIENYKDNENKKEIHENENNKKVIQDLENEIVEKEKIIDRMEEDLIKYNNEIHSLKVMVQKECEERFELTESLNRAREQLLMIGEYGLSKGPVNLPPIQQRNSCSSTASVKTNSSQNSQKSSVYEKQSHVDSQRRLSKNSIISTKRKLEKLFNE